MLLTCRQVVAREITCHWNWNRFTPNTHVYEIGAHMIDFDVFASTVSIALRSIYFFLCRIRPSVIWYSCEARDTTRMGERYQWVIHLVSLRARQTRYRKPRPTFGRHTDTHTRRHVQSSKKEDRMPLPY